VLPAVPPQPLPHPTPHPPARLERPDGILEARHGVHVGVQREVADVALHKDLAGREAQDLVGLVGVAWVGGGWIEAGGEGGARRVCVCAESGQRSSCQGSGLLVLLRRAGRLALSSCWRRGGAPPKPAPTGTRESLQPSHRNSGDFGEGADKELGEVKCRRAGVRQRAGPRRAAGAAVRQRSPAAARRARRCRGAGAARAGRACWCARRLKKRGSSSRTAAAHCLRGWGRAAGQARGARASQRGAARGAARGAGPGPPIRRARGALMSAWGAFAGRRARCCARRRPSGRSRAALGALGRAPAAPAPRTCSRRAADRCWSGRTAGPRCCCRWAAATAAPRPYAASRTTPWRLPEAFQTGAGPGWLPA
jgi:hypothetical protein